MKPWIKLTLFSIIIWMPFAVHAQLEEQKGFWQEIEEADRNFSSAATTRGRTQAFLEVLTEDAIVFRAGPVDARGVYTENQYLYRLDQVDWRSHFIDVSRSGDFGVAVGPNRFTSNSGDILSESFGYIVGVWIKMDSQWKTLAAVFVRLPGYLSLDVKPDFADTEKVLLETAPPALVENTDLQTLIDSDNRFGESINFRGGQRAMIRYGLQNLRVYLPGMAPAVGVEAASTVYGKFLDSHVATTNPVTMRYMGGYLASSKEIGVTYGIMATVTDEGTAGFQASYLRVWRFSNTNEWRIALELVSPF